MSGTRVVATWVSLAGAALAGVGLFAVLSWIAVAQAQPAGGTWGQRAPLPAANSETAVAQTEDKIYVLGGYPSDRVSVATVQIYDIATDTWEFGPPLPATNNHGMAAAVGGRVYAIGGQATAQGGYTDAVLELDPAVGDPAAGVWVPKAPMPTPRSGGVAIVADGKIYVAGGRPPRGNDFAVYDPALDQWTVLPDLPSQRNHIAGGLMGGKIYVVGGRLAGGFRSEATAVVEVFDPATNTWAAAAPLPARAAASTASSPLAACTCGAAKARLACSRTTTSTTRARTPGPTWRTCRSPSTGSPAPPSRVGSSTWPAAACAPAAPAAALCTRPTHPPSAASDPPARGPAAHHGWRGTIVSFPTVCVFPHPVVRFAPILSGIVGL